MNKLSSAEKLARNLRVVAQMDPHVDQVIYHVVQKWHGLVKPLGLWLTCHDSKGNVLGAVDHQGAMSKAVAHFGVRPLTW